MIDQNTQNSPLQIIEDHPDMKSVKVSPARIGTDYGSNIKIWKSMFM